MEAIEQAIRNALAKSDANNPAIRQKIYESAWGAHERSLAANGALDDDQREDRRERLKASIIRIEKEIQTVGELTPPPPPASVEERLEPVMPDDTIPSIEPASRVEPTLSAMPEANLGTPDSVAEEAVVADNYRPERLQQRGSRKTEHKKASGFSKLLILFALLAVALGLLWVVASGIVNQKPSSAPPMTADTRTNSESQEPVKEGQVASESTWITIFDPADSTGVSVAGRATASVDGDQLEKFLRIKSPGEADDISFAVGQGVLEQLVGKNAVFDIIAKTQDGTSTQIAVSCDFGNLGDCGRTRFDVSDANGEYLVQKQFPADKQPAAGGVIKINSDVSQAGKSVDIISIRVQITN